MNSPPNQPSPDIENSSLPSHSADDRRIPLIYVLPSSDMYGTERMALATAEGLTGDYHVIFLGYLGPAIFEARKLGFETREFQSTPQMIKLFFRVLREFGSLTFVSTLPRYTKYFLALNFFMRRKVRMIHMIHGGGYESVDYAGLRRLNKVDVTFVAVSEYGRQRLIHHGIRADHTAVVGNFMIRRQLDAMPRRPRFERDGVRKVAVVARVDPPKRVDLLLDALDRCGDAMRDVSFRVLGWGPDLDRLSARAAKSHPNVVFAGYVDNVPEELAAADLLVHTCAVETFGMAVLEAMSVNLPTLVPDAAGTAMLVRDGETGFKYKPEDADDLARKLMELKNAPAELLNRIAQAAQLDCATRFSQDESIRQYRQIFSPR